MWWLTFVIQGLLRLDGREQTENGPHRTVETTREAPKLFFDLHTSKWHTHPTFIHPITGGKKLEPGVEANACHPSTGRQRQADL